MNNCTLSIAVSGLEVVHGGTSVSDRFPPRAGGRRWSIFCAAAAMNAAERGLQGAANDPGVLEAFWLLVRIPLAAALRELGLDVPTAPSLLDITVAYSAAVDARMPNGRERTDLAELAQLAGTEAINSTVGPRAQSLFGTGPGEVRAALAALATPAQFGGLGRRFIARFGFRLLDSFISRALPQATGPDRHFPIVAAQNQFASNMALGAYEVFEATGYLAEPEWPATPFKELLRVAFKGRLIDTLDHPVLRRLCGEV